MFNWKFTFFLILFFQSVCAFATDRVSAGTGNWNTAGTWSPSGVPVAGDNVTITTGHVISMNANGSCNNLTISGTANWTAIRTITVGGNIIVNGGGAITGGATGTYNVAGTLTVPAGGTATIGRTNISVTGTSTISGTLVFNNTNGAKTFSNITVSSGGTWNVSATVPFTISGNISNNGAFQSSNGVYTLTGAAKTLGGTRNLIFGSVSISGSYTNTDSLRISTGFDGTGTLTQGTNSYLVIADLTPAGILTATASGNTVRYLASASMNSLDINYHHLIAEGPVNGNGTYTVTGNYSVVSGTASLTRVSVGGNVTVNSGSTLNVGRGPTVFSGTTTVNGTLNFTSTTSTKVLNNVTVNVGGIWNASVAEAFTINGNISVSGTFTSNTGTYTLAGAAKTISGTLSISSVAVTGSYTNNAVLTVSTGLTGAGTFTQGTTGTLNMGAASASFSVTNFAASASGNTVNYNRAGAQNIRTPSGGSYHHLTLAGSGNKSLLAAADINGNLTITSVFVAASFNITLAGNWSNSGNFTPGTNTVTLDGAAQTITRSGGETFNHLIVSGSGTKTLGSAITTSGNLTINSSLDASSSNFGVTVQGNWSNNGTFTRRSGTVTFSGTSAQTIGGSSTTDFYNITQSNAAGVSLSRAQNLYNTLTISSGTFTTTGFSFTLISDASGTARIAAIPSGANFSGNIIMQRYTGTGPTDWRFFSSAVSGATIADWADDFATSGFTGSTDPTNSFVSIYSYNEAATGVSDSGYVAATNVTNSISNGKGFWVYMGPNPVTYEVTGPPNTFTVTPSISFTSNAGASHDGWNLIANPYPSAIDWDDANWTKTNVDNAVYVYNSSTGSFSSYVGGIGVNGGSRYIASQQAFWVKANAASPVVRMVENVKSSQNPAYLKQSASFNTSYYPMAFKDFPVPLNTNTLPNSIRLTANGNGFDDEAIIHFQQGASPDFDGPFDAWKMQNLNPLSPNLASVINDTVDLSINTYQELSSDVVIPVRLRVPSSGTYSIRRDSILMLPMSSCIFLEDLANGNMIDLRSAISYSFTISDTTDAPRFLLHIYAPISKEAVMTHCADDSSGMAIAKGTGTGPWNYVWKNAAGGVVQTTNNSSMADTLFNLPVGVYTIEVSGSACGIVTDTLEVRSSSLLSMIMNYENVTCNGLSDGSAYATVSAGSAPYSYMWNNGATSSAVNGLSAGNYSVIITDAQGCSLTQVAVIAEPPVLLAGFSASADTVDLSTYNSVVFTDTSSGATTYYWDFGDTTVPDTTQSPVHYYSYAGTYNVMLIVSNGTCSDTSYAQVMVIDSLLSTAVHYFSSNSSVQVQYGADGTWLAFDLPDSREVNMRLYNILGELTAFQKEGNVKKQRIKLNMIGLKKGIYLLSVKINSETVFLKILIQ